MYGLPPVETGQEEYDRCQNLNNLMHHIGVRDLVLLSFAGFVSRDCCWPVIRAYLHPSRAPVFRYDHRQEQAIDKENVSLPTVPRSLFTLSASRLLGALESCFRRELCCQATLVCVTWFQRFGRPGVFVGPATAGRNAYLALFCWQTDCRSLCYEGVRQSIVLSTAFSFWFPETIRFS